MFTGKHDRVVKYNVNMGHDTWNLLTLTQLYCYQVQSQFQSVQINESEREINQ